MRYKHNMPLNDRVDQLLGWLDKPVSERPNFLSLYIPNVDSAGHAYGVKSKQVIVDGFPQLLHIQYDS